MIQIVSIETGNVLASLDISSLVGADLSERDLRDAELQGASLDHVDACHADFQDSDMTGISGRHALFIGPNWDARSCVRQIFATVT